MDFQTFSHERKAEKNSAVNKVVIGKDRKDSKNSIKNKQKNPRAFGTSPGRRSNILNTSACCLLWITKFECCFPPKA